MEFEKSGSSAMIWLVLIFISYHWRLCLSPVALSFITKHSSSKSFLMMGVYFAATGLGNKVAGIIGESASDLGEYSVFCGIHGYYRGNIYDVAKTIKSINSRC
jgi:POT family proton-dependent oligopeptide transporter